MFSLSPPPVQARRRVVIAEEYSDWLLGYWGRQLSQHWQASLSRIPLSRRELRDPTILALRMRHSAVVFIGHKPFLAASRFRLLRRECRYVVLVTHMEDPDELVKARLHSSIQSQTTFACMNSSVSAWLAGQGFSTEVVLAGADVPVERGVAWQERELRVVMSLDLKPRKNLSLAIDILNSLDIPATIFVRKPTDVGSLVGSPGRKISVELFDWNRYTERLGNSRCVLSTAELEGGPMPLIEGLQSGCNFIATPTGFADDLRELTGVGIVVSREAPMERWLDAIRLGLNETNPAARNLDYLSEEAFMSRLIVLTRPSMRDG